MQKTLPFQKNINNLGGRASWIILIMLAGDGGALLSLLANDYATKLNQLAPMEAAMHQAVSAGIAMGRHAFSCSLG